ncbi:hypothetical protein LXL04_030694 [Taraxacum kok-saghyz]
MTGDYNFKDEGSCKSVERWLEEKSSTLDCLYRISGNNSALDWYFNEITMGMEHFLITQSCRKKLKLDLELLAEHNENTSLGLEVCTCSLSFFKKIQKLFLRHHQIRLWCCNMSMASNCSTIWWGKGVKTRNRVKRSLHIVSIKASRKGCCDKHSHDDTVLNLLLLPFGSPFYVFKPTIDLALAK